MAGRVLPIRTVGDPVLHRPCVPVTAFDTDLVALVADMFASMYAADGVGLAANQVGVALRVFVYDCPDATGTHRKGLVVNPTLKQLPLDQRHLDDSPEGCLSIPGQHATLARPEHAVVDGYDTTGQPVTVEGDGLLARCLQHEVDHLEGRLYIDRLPARQRRHLLAAAGLAG